MYIWERLEKIITLSATWNWSGWWERCHCRHSAQSSSICGMITSWWVISRDKLLAAVIHCYHWILICLSWMYQTFFGSWIWCAPGQLKIWGEISKCFKNCIEGFLWPQDVGRCRSYFRGQLALLDLLVILLEDIGKTQSSKQSPPSSETLA